MHAITVTPDHQLVFANVAAPELHANEIRIAVRATAVNRADLLQRAGHYPPPPGASEILGLECAGIVAESNSSRWKPGDRVMALLPGGGYAEEAVVDAGSVMRIPDALSFEEAAAIPETFLTAFLNLFLLARVEAGESVLIHGGGSGVGTAATTLCKLAGVRVVVTAGSAEKCALCIEHGADDAINYREEDFVERARGVNVILDHIGARYLTRDLDAIGTDGRIVFIGSFGGEREAALDIGKLMRKRASVIGSVLRARTNADKARIVAAFVERFGADLEAGRIKPVVHEVIPLARADDAHRLMETSEHFGKIVLGV